MSQQSSYIAHELERVGRQILAHCATIPEPILFWSPPQPGMLSLFTVATHMLEIIDRWIFLPIAGRSLEEETQHTVPRGYPALKERYEQWIQEVHYVLDSLPEAMMCLYIGPRSGENELNQEMEPGPLFVYQCLFKALEQGGRLLGYIECLCHLYMTGERVHTEILQAYEL